MLLFLLLLCLFLPFRSTALHSWVGWNALEVKRRRCWAYWSRPWLQEFRRREEEVRGVFESVMSWLLAQLEVASFNVGESLSDLFNFSKKLTIATTSPHTLYRVHTGTGGRDGWNGAV